MKKRVKKWRGPKAPVTTSVIVTGIGEDGVNILDCLKEQFPNGVHVGNNSFQAKALKRVKKLNKKHETRRTRTKDGKQKDKGVDPRDDLG